MIKNHRKLLAFLLCAALLCTLAGFTVAGTAHDDHDHDHESEALNAVLASPLVTSLDFEAVPLAGDPEVVSLEDEASPEPQQESTTAPEPTPTPTPESTPEPTPEATQEPPADTTSPEPPADTTTPPPAATQCPHKWETRVESSSFDCYYGTTERYYEVCTLCGARTDTASRPVGTWTKQEHEFRTENIDSGCPGNPSKQLTCNKCGYSKFEQGGHTWGPWTGSGANQTRTCSSCNKTESKICSHNWVKHETPSTCTVHGSSYEQCSLCGAKRNENNSLPLAPHKYSDNSDDCTKSKTCSVCGTTSKGYSSHSFTGQYGYDNDSHWQKCARCAVEQKVAHTRANSTDCTKLGKCTVCGAPAIDSGKQHNYTIKGSSVLAYHEKKCSNPGCSSTIREDHYTSNAKVCGVAQWCDFCGVKMSDASGSHSYGGWTATASGHSRTCTICGYTQTASHTANRSGNGSCTTSITCTTCGYVVTKGYSDHSFGVWMSNGSTHYRTCTHPGCTAQQSSAHTGGKATCTSAAVCSICGASYGSKSNSHVGGTEIRNAKPAEVGKAGYTGDTYCLGCGKKISSGSTIKALSENHKHSFTGAWHSDSASHWHQCSCGERGDEAAHSFKNGKCSVCGVADPNYKVCSGSSHVGGTELKNAKAAEVGKAGYTGDLYCTACGKMLTKGTNIPALKADHVHEYSVVWRTDGASHWKDCTCGDIAQKSAHSFKNGVCSVCGVVDPNYVKTCSGNNHVGGTELRGHVAAAVGKAGYTGDTYCQGCGKLLTKGTEIKALAENHVHKYSSTWNSDANNHWKDCSCGEVSRKAAHTFINGKCTVCGVDDPNAAEKAHAHKYGDLISDGQYHWRVCTICGLQAEKTAHTILNGSCMTCGYQLPAIEKVKDVSTKDWFYDSVKTVVEAGLLSGGKSADKNTSFKPTDEVSLADTVDALYRLAGSPAASTETKFKDVKAGDYFASAAAWITANSIVEVEGDEFNADKATTMEEMVTLLWRFAQTAGWKTDVKGFEAPKDADEAEAAEAMAWAADQGLTEELYGDEAVTADSVVNRAEAATILAKFMTLIEENGLPEIENGVEEVST